MQHIPNLKINYIVIYYLIFQCIPLAIHSQNIEWQKCFGGSGNEIANCVIQSRDGGFLIVGYTTSTDYDAQNNHGANDGMVIKTDSLGNLIWSKCYGGSNDDFISCVIETDDGNFILGGASRSTDGDLTNNFGASDAWILKISDQGAILWQKTYGGTQDELITQIQTDANGNLYLLANSYSNDLDVHGQHGDRDIWIVKIDSIGGLIQEKCIGGSASDLAFSMTTATNGNLLIYGTTGSTDGNVSGNHGDYDTWFIDVDTNLNLINQKCYGGRFEDYGYSIIQKDSNKIELVGYSLSDDGDIYGVPDTLFGNYFNIEIDIFSNIYRSITYGGSYPDEARSVVISTDGNIIITGSSASTDGQVTGNHGDGDFWVLESDSNGILLWENCFGGFGAEYPYDSKLTRDNGLIMVGHAGDNSGDVSGFHGGFTDFWVVKLGIFSTNINSIKKNNLKIYPNPTVNEVNIKGCSEGDLIEVFDFMGNLIFEKYALQIEDQINLDSLPMGIYILFVGNYDSFKIIKN